MENEKLSKILHDINNVLCSLIGCSEMLIEIENRSYQKKLLNHMQISIQRLKLIIEDTYNSINEEEKEAHDM